MIYCVKKGWPSLKDLCLHGKFGRAKSFWRCATTNHVNSLATTERNKLKSLAWLPLHIVSFLELYFEFLICPDHSILKGSSRICPLFAESSGRAKSIWKCVTTNHVNSLATTERNKLKSLAWLPLHTVSFLELYFESLICPGHSILKGRSRICLLFAESSDRDYATVKSALVCASTIWHCEISFMACRVSRS